MTDWEHRAREAADRVVALQRSAVILPGAESQRRGGGLSRDLVEFETLAEAEYLERLAADDELVRFLQLSGFDLRTREWQSFARALAEYGYAVFRAWFGTGEIVRRLARRGVHGRESLPSPLTVADDAVLELAAELVVRAIRSFRTNILLNGRWRADGGATLKTYFVGHALFLFPETFRQWHRANGLEAVFDPNEPPVEPVASPATDLTDTRLVVADMLAVLPLLTRRMFELQFTGRDVREIAEELGVSASRVKTDMHRARKRMRLSFPEVAEWAV